MSATRDFNRDAAGELRALRRDIVSMAEHSAHVAVALSCVDILAAVYFGGMRPQAAGTQGDRFILSKGHGAMALYAVLCRAGFFDRSQLETYGRDGSMLAEHPLAGKVPGLLFAAGSLGHGLAAAAGLAEGLRLMGSQDRVFTLLGDGECDEGSVWEAVALGASRRLGALTAIIDWNGFQACGRCDAISRGISLPRCWEAFGWAVEEVDGHDFHALRTLLAAQGTGGRPRVLFCRTVKGKGVPFMEGNLEWHYRPVSGEDRAAALRGLGDA